MIAHGKLRGRNTRERILLLSPVKVGKIPTVELVACQTRTAAQVLVRQCLESGTVIYGFHVKEALKDDDLDILDAAAVLRSGQIYNEPEQDIKSGEWKYRIEGRAVDGKRLAIVFCFKKLDTCFCITAFALER